MFELARTVADFTQIVSGECRQPMIVAVGSPGALERTAGQSPPSGAQPRTRWCRSLTRRRRVHCQWMVDWCYARSRYLPARTASAPPSTSPPTMTPATVRCAGFCSRSSSSAPSGSSPSWRCWSTSTRSSRSDPARAPRRRGRRGGRGSSPTRSARVPLLPGRDDALRCSWGDRHPLALPRQRGVRAGARRIASRAGPVLGGDPWGHAGARSRGAIAARPTRPRLHGHRHPALRTSTTPSQEKP